LPKIIFIISLLIVAIVIYVVFPILLVEWDVFILERKIMKNNQNIEHVQIYNYENLPPLSEGWIIINFKDGGWLELSNVNKEQDDVTLESCNGYIYFTIRRSYENGFENITSINGLTNDRFGIDINKLLLGRSLSNIDDFIKSYSSISNVMNTITEIPIEKIHELDRQTINNLLINKKPTAVVNSFEYYVFKKSTEYIILNGKRLDF
jgi:hypothetical protein